MTDLLWNEAWKLLGWGVLFVAGVVWLSKSIASHWLERKLKYLESELQIGTERLKAQLDRLSTEHEVRFSLLHTKRAEVIAELWEKIRDAHSHTLALALRVERGMDLELSRKSAEAAWEAVRSATDLLQKRKIWLSEPLARRIDDLISRELFDPSFTYHYYLQSKYSAAEVVETAKAWASKNSETIGLIEELEREFRAELGVANVAPPNRPLQPTSGASAIDEPGRS